MQVFQVQVLLQTASVVKDKFCKIDPSTPSMRKGRDRGKKDGGGERMRKIMASMFLQVVDFLNADRLERRMAMPKHISQKLTELWPSLICKKSQNFQKIANFYISLKKILDGH